MQFTNVVLPDPFGPIRPRISPRPSLRSTPASAAIPPNRFASPAISSTAPGAPSPGRGIGQARHHDRKFEDLRRDDADGVDVERTGGAGIERTEQKGGKAQRPTVEADRRGGDGVLAQHQEGQPPGAARRLPGGKRAE